MPTLALTDRHIRTLKPTGRRVDHFDRSVTGLALRLSVSGRKTWCVFFRVNRRLRRMTVGHYPAVTLQEARHGATVACSRPNQAIAYGGCFPSLTEWGL
jgi:hypothetical protein